MITVTKDAAEKFKELFKDRPNPGNTMVRIVFGGFGWGGPRLQLTLDELKNNDDVVIESEGITVIYGSELEMYMKDLVIDYSNNWFNKGFSLRGGRTSSC